MNHIYIEHNPFLVETIFHINNRPIADGCILQNHKNVRFQRWVENLFIQLRDEIFNGDSEFSIKFKGVKSDFFDLEEAAQNARNDGMSIELEHIICENAESRLDKVKVLMQKVEQDPVLNKHLADHKDNRLIFDEALNNQFDVYVVATMSSGKSTLINAMLGKDLLPAANQATTATIAEIHDNKGKGKLFTGHCYSNSETLLAQSNDLTLETMRDWNSNPETKKIIIEGNITAVTERDNISMVLTDTPGPNYSQDPEHKLITMKHIQDSKRNPLILYVLNATQLGINDDKNLLNLVAEQMIKGGKQGKDRFIFAINKMDSFDPEAGEDLERVLDNVRRYLGENGIDNPYVFPISAHLARLLRINPDKLTKKERNEKNNLTEVFLELDEFNLPDYMSLGSSVKHRLNGQLEAEELTQAEYRSGLPAIEATIDEYINKYSFPHRLKRAHESLKHILSVGMKKADLITKLNRTNEEIENIKNTLVVVKSKIESGNISNAYKERVLREGKRLPDEIQFELNKKSAKVNLLFNELARKFQEKVDPLIAENELKDATEKLTYESNALINEYQHVFERSQKLIKAEFHQDYQKYVIELFPESGALNLPIFEDLVDTISSFPLNLVVENDDIQKKNVKTGSRTVSDSTWWKPWTWGRSHEVAIYEMKEYVNLETLWSKRADFARGKFADLISGAENKIEEDKQKLLESYIAYIENEFTNRFNVLFDELDTLTSNKTECEVAAKHAQDELDRIFKLEDELESILAL